MWFAIQILRLFADLHSTGIHLLHGDVKPDNFLLIGYPSPLTIALERLRVGV